MGEHILGAREVRDRSRHAPDAIVSTNGKAQPLCRAVQQAKSRAVQPTVATEQSRCEFGVRANLMTLIPFLLPIPRRDNPASYCRGRLARSRFLEHFGMQSGNLDSEIDAVAKRAGQPASISIDLLRRTPTLSML
jgi:hypothetical protein